MKREFDEKLERLAIKIAVDKIGKKDIKFDYEAALLFLKDTGLSMRGQDPDCYVLTFGGDYKLHPKYTALIQLAFENGFVKLSHLIVSNEDEAYLTEKGLIYKVAIKDTIEKTEDGKEGKEGKVLISNTKAIIITAVVPRPDGGVEKTEIVVKMSKIRQTILNKLSNPKVSDSFFRNYLSDMILKTAYVYAFKFLPVTKGSKFSAALLAEKDFNELDDDAFGIDIPEPKISFSSPEVAANDFLKMFEAIEAQTEKELTAKFSALKDAAQKADKFGEIVFSATKIYYDKLNKIKNGNN